MITVQVKLFATLRRHAPNVALGEALPVELAEGATVRDLLVELDLPDTEVKVVFVNGIVRKEKDALSHDDEVGIFPPVGGG
jgi:molybdopterin converting factor small subunit